jgi:carboxyl-terminal processing protease
LKSFFKNIVGLALTVCVIISLTVTAFFAMYPREWVDFIQVMYFVNKGFKEPIPVGTMLEGAIAGLAGSAGDRHTFYLPPERNMRRLMATQGLTGAIGVTIDSTKQAEDRIIIREVRPNSGAAAAGLWPEDAILQIDDRLVDGLTVDECVALIRGAPDTYVSLLVAREGEAEKTYVVKRTATITIETVMAGFLKDELTGADKIGYISIDYFARNTGDAFDESLDFLLEEGAQGLILDVRFNGGGDVLSTAQVAGRLLPGGELMTLARRDSSQLYSIYRPNPISIPYVILINGASASASEILAGAVQDGARGLLVGTGTFGKGSVQQIYTLLSGSGLNVTEGLYSLPSGRLIEGEGIEPDFLVASDPAGETDPQLQKAVELMKDIIAGRETVQTLLAKSDRQATE